MSTKQIATSVLGGRKVNFRTLQGPIEGYVVGADDYHWLVAVVQGSGPKVITHLVHKSAPLITLARQPTLDEEPGGIREELDAMITPYANWLISAGFKAPQQ